MHDKLKHELSASGQAVSEKAVRDALESALDCWECEHLLTDAVVEKMLAALSSTPAQQTVSERSEGTTEAPVNVPSGWKLVPIEPTPEMVEAAFVGIVETQDVQGQLRRRQVMADNYCKMLAAAAAAPAPAQTAAQQTVFDRVILPEAQQSEKDAERAIKDQIRAAYDDGYNHGKADGTSGCSRYVGGNVEVERGNRVIAAIAKEKAK